MGFFRAGFTFSASLASVSSQRDSEYQLCFTEKTGDGEADQQAVCCSGWRTGEQKGSVVCSQPAPCQPTVCYVLHRDTNLTLAVNTL